MRQTICTYLSCLGLTLFSMIGSSQGFENSQSYRDYLNNPVKAKEFDKNQWEIIKRSIVDGIAEENYTISDSVEGDPFLTDKDNPYKQSKESYNKHLQSKKGYRPDKISKNEKKSPKSSSSSSSFSVPSSLGKVLAVIVIPLFAFLIYMLFFKSPMNLKSQKIEENLDQRDPSEIPKSELELLLEKATANKNYREAIRVYFIFIIRGLIEKKWIEWEKEKTNLSYLYEMKNKPLYADFESVVSVYEIVWYGERIPTEEEYKLLEPRFKSLMQKLSK